MMYRIFFTASVVACLLIFTGCGSTETRADAGSSVVSDEPVYAKGVTMRVDGLGCPMCAESISILMGNIDAVVNSRVDLSTGTVRAELNPSVAVTESELRRAIVDGGFTFRSISFEK